MTEKLRYLSEKVASELHRNVEVNLDRYLSGDFLSLEKEGGWSIKLGLEVDLEPLQKLEAGAGSAAEVRNSLLVWKALSHMTPSLARENRIWTRLAHIECLLYARARWLSGVSSGNAAEAVRTHFFANTVTRCRDDHAIGRLWWNAYIAGKAMPDDHERALGAMLKTADIRSNLVERPWVTSRPGIAAGIIRTIVRRPAITATESAFRGFMKTVNRRGGGVLFELMDERELDSFMDACAEQAPHCLERASGGTG
ncbi:MAG: DUF6339 family protein [Acidiferrobacteraceae bacterium]